MAMKRRTWMIVGAASILTALLVTFALSQQLLSAALEALVAKPVVAAELKTVTLKVEGWVCFG